MSAIVVISAAPSFASLATPHVWTWSASYQLDTIGTYQAGNVSVTETVFNVPFSKVLDDIRAAVILDASTNFSVTLTDTDIVILGLNHF